MVTSLAAPEATLLQRAVPDSGFYSSGTTPRFVSPDDLYLNLVEANRDRHFGSAWSEEPRNTLIYIDAPVRGQQSLSGIQNGQLMEFRIQIISQGRADNPTSDSPRFVIMPRRYSIALDSASSPSDDRWGKLFAAFLKEWTKVDIPPIVQEFAAGLDGVTPSPETVAIAGRLAQAVLDYTAEPALAVDVDGALSFDLRLRNGLLLLAELSVAGTLDVGVYDPAAGKEIRHFPQATADQLLDLLR